MLAYVNGFFAGLSGCVLPVLSVLITKRNKYRFVLEFFLAQLLLFSLLNVSLALVYGAFQWLQPIFLLLGSFITFYSAYIIYIAKPINIPGSGAVYGIALSPCSIGFAIATSTLSFNVIDALLNALLFSLGIITPIAVLAFLLHGTEKYVSNSRWFEILSVVILIIVSYYLAYLAGSTWRWSP